MWFLDGILSGYIIIVLIIPSTTMQLTWLGHASFKILGAGKVIYIDPYAGNYDEKADIILVTHDHFDHFVSEKIIGISSDSTIIFSTSSVASHLNTVIALSPGDKKDAEGIIIEAVQAYNTNKRFHPKGLGIGFVISVEGKKIYHAGDTDRIPEMKYIKCDVALLPVSGTYVMNAKEAVEALKDIKPKFAIPMHFGAIAGTIDDAELFKELSEKETGIEVKILKEGEKIVI